MVLSAERTTVEAPTLKVVVPPTALFRSTTQPLAPEPEPTMVEPVPVLTVTTPPPEPVRMALPLTSWMVRPLAIRTLTAPVPVVAALMAARPAPVAVTFWLTLRVVTPAPPLAVRMPLAPPETTALLVTVSAAPVVPASMPSPPVEVTAAATLIVTAPPTEVARMPSPVALMVEVAAVSTVMTPAPLAAATMPRPPAWIVPTVSMSIVPVVLEASMPSRVVLTRLPPTTVKTVLAPVVVVVRMASLAVAVTTPEVPMLIAPVVLVARMPVPAELTATLLATWTRPPMLLAQRPTEVAPPLALTEPPVVKIWAPPVPFESATMPALPPKMAPPVDWMLIEDALMALPKMPKPVTASTDVPIAPVLKMVMPATLSLATMPASAEPAMAPELLIRMPPVPA